MTAGARTARGPIRLGTLQFVYSALFVLVVVPFAVWLIIGGYLYEEYVLEVKAPPLRQRFGFSMDRVRIGSPPDAYEVSAISTVTPGGLLARAGFRPGDVPTGYVDAGRAAFYQELQAVLDGDIVTFRLTTVESLQTGNGEQRRVTLGPLELPAAEGENASSNRGAAQQ
jgi:hypothetical protein